MTSTLTPYRSSLPPGRAGFAQLLRAEWAKFWTVWRLLAGLLLAALVVAGLSVLAAGGSNVGDPQGTHHTIGPGGMRVNDSFRFVHRPLTGDGSITAEVASLTAATEREGGVRPEPWAKAGVMIKQSVKAGAPYAAMLFTPGHGVRLQYDFTHDQAGTGPSGARWLRLTRHGPVLTGYVSADGEHWTRTGSVRPHGLGGTVQVGVFAASPDHLEVQRQFGSTSEAGSGVKATGRFEHVSLQGVQAGAAWRGTTIGFAGDPNDFTSPRARAAKASAGSSHVAGDTVTATGTGDIGPFTDPADPVQTSMQGVFVGVLVVAALGALFVTAEYKRGMIRTTLSASPRRGRVLVAKALVVGAVTFAVALPATAIAFPLAQHRLQSNGFRPPLFPRYGLTDPISLRVVIGSAAILALVAVLAMAVGALLRHSAAAITLVIVAIVLPQILAFALPLGPSSWLLRVTPAAAFAVQQGASHPEQVAHTCLPEDGCYPLAPWPGFSVLAAYTVVLLALAVWRIRRRDA
ncbi:MAG: ABC transporter permease subunit [Kitasatospora sp.]|jgi:ABC-type transport system involved in multi-copper enzyme maturation permease subunit|nr:ABC transporter permease subunit [Kitasatospora sp.]